MSEKIVITAGQAELINNFTRVASTKSHILRNHIDGWVSEENKKLNTLTIDQMARILYEPNSYEVEKPLIKVGDKVMVQWMNVKGEKFYEVTKVDKYVYVKSEKYGTNFGPHDIMRHATKEEIFWVELGREVGEFVEGDAYVRKSSGNIYQIDDLYSERKGIAKKAYEEGKLKVFYPANSFIEFP